MSNFFFFKSLIILCYGHYAATEVLRSHDTNYHAVYGVLTYCMSYSNEFRSYQI